MQPTTAGIHVGSVEWKLSRLPWTAKWAHGAHTAHAARHVIPARRRGAEASQRRMKMVGRNAHTSQRTRHATQRPVPWRKLRHGHSWPKSTAGMASGTRNTVIKRPQRRRVPPRGLLVRGCTRCHARRKNSICAIPILCLEVVRAVCLKTRSLLKLAAYISCTRQLTTPESC